MRKILLVDDDILVRTNVKLMLKDLSYELNICGEASNGLEALQLIEELRPDIVLSDMMMPQMDGLELCKIVHNKYPSIIFIALSNYDDFDYVRGTLKNGGVDYLLKHKLNSESLSKVLTSVVIDLPKNSDFSITHIAGDSLNTLRRKFVLDLLSGMFLTSNEYQNSIKVLDIRLAEKQIVPIILSIDNYNQFMQNQSLKKQNVIEFSIVNISNEILENYQTGVLVHIENGNYCILLSFYDTPSESKTNETIHSILQQISSNLKTYLNISSSFSIGSICSNITELNKSYECAKQALEFKFYSGNHSILQSNNKIEHKKPLTGLDYQLETNLLSITATGNYEKVKELLDEIFRYILIQRLSIMNAQMIFTDLISVITRIAKKKNISLDSIFHGLVPPNEILTQLSTLIQIQDWFLKSFEALCQQMLCQLTADSEYVQKAIACIHRDYSKPISLQSVSEEIGISHGYLSTNFKSETGQGFSEYLNVLRISMAAHMLDLGETDFHKIASECGFQDYSYFFKVFKKNLNITPKEFLKNTFNWKK